jgi:hypothetical protein
MSLLIATVAAAVVTAFLTLILRAKSSAVPPSLQAWEDAEQMRAVGPRDSRDGADRNPVSTLT